MKTKLIRWGLYMLFCMQTIAGFCQKLKPYLAENGKYLGLINEAHEIVQKPTYCFIYKHDFGYWVRSKTYKEGYLSENGKPILPCKYQKIREWRDQKLFWVKEGGLWGLADPKTGKMIFKPQFVAVYTIRGQNAYVVTKQWLRGVIKSDGTFVIPTIYKTLEDSYKPCLLARNQEGKYGYVSPKGKIQIPFVYKDARQFWRKKAKVTKDGKNWVIIDETGRLTGKTELPAPDMVKDYNPRLEKIKNRGGTKTYPIFEKNYGVKKYPQKTIKIKTYTYTIDDEQAYLQQLVECFSLDTLRLPRKARRKKVQGKVKLQFMVTEKGVLKHIKVLQGLPYGCNEVAMHLLRAVPKWNPANSGHPVTSLNTVEVTFDYTQFDRKGRRKEN